MNLTLRGNSLSGHCNKSRMVKLSVKLIAVEVSKPCTCHRLVLARKLDARYWLYFFVKEPSWVEFGDRLLFYPATLELFLDKGPTLTYRAQLDDMSPDAALELAMKLPYPEMYPGDSTPWEIVGG